jgi:hypothetical protein
MFRWLVSGSLDFLAGQLVNKLITAIATLPVLIWSEADIGVRAYRQHGSDRPQPRV